MTGPVASPAQAAALEARADAASAARQPAEAEALLARAVELAPPRAELWLKLAMVRRGRGDAAGALAAVTGALSLDPLAFMPLLLRSLLLADLGQPAQAAEAAAAALFHAPPRATLPPVIAAQLDRAAQLAGAHATREAARLDALTAAARTQADGAERARIDRFISNSLRVTRPYAQQPTHFHFPGLPVIEFFGVEQLPWLRRLADGAAEIRAEFDALMAAEAAEIAPYVQYPADVPLAQWRGLNGSARWSAIHLLQNGARVERNARHCPRTLTLWGATDPPDVPGRSPNLMFSLLAPHTRIPPHTGVTNTRLVVHLPLVVPPGCGLRVGAETRTPQPGRPFAFDDTIEHEAWNDSGQLRVVLIGDAWRPDLTPTERTAAAAVMAQGPFGGL